MRSGLRRGLGRLKLGGRQAHRVYARERSGCIDIAGGQGDVVDCPTLWRLVFAAQRFVPLVEPHADAKVVPQAGPCARMAYGSWLVDSYMPKPGELSVLFILPQGRGE